MSEGGLDRGRDLGDECRHAPERRALGQQRLPRGRNVADLGAAHVDARCRRGHDGG
jgi:hypothetical protein